MRHCFSLRNERRNSCQRRWGWSREHNKVNLDIGMMGKKRNCLIFYAVTPLHFKHCCSRTCRGAVCTSKIERALAFAQYDRRLRPAEGPVRLHSIIFRTIWLNCNRLSVTSETRRELGYDLSLENNCLVHLIMKCAQMSCE